MDESIKEIRNMCAELEAREKLYDDRFRRDMERLKTLEDIQREQTIIMTRQAQLSGNMQKLLGDHETRLRTIELKPTHWLERLLTPLMSVVISAIVAAVIYYLQNG